MPETSVGPPQMLQDVILSTASMIREIACALVDHPDRVAVRPIMEAGATTMLLTVGNGDLSRVVGKQGRTAQSLRVLVDAVARRTGHRLELDIQADR